MARVCVSVRGCDCMQVALTGAAWQQLLLESQEHEALLQLALQVSCCWGCQSIRSACSWRSR